MAVVVHYRHRALKCASVRTLYAVGANILKDLFQGGLNIRVHSGVNFVTAAVEHIFSPLFLVAVLLAQVVHHLIYKCVHKVGVDFGFVKLLFRGNKVKLCVFSRLVLFLGNVPLGIHLIKHAVSAF